MIFGAKRPGTLFPIEEILAFHGMDVMDGLATATLLKGLLGGVVAIKFLSGPLIYAGFETFLTAETLALAT